MSKFNTKQEIPKTTSYEGAELYQKNPVEDWINFMFSSFLSKQYYETETEQITRFLDLTQKVIEAKGEEFAAKGAFFTRNELGMRSVAILVAAYLNNMQFEGKRQFYARFPHRPDDAAELFAAIEMMGTKRSHATVRGIGDYLSKLTPYQLAKYKLKGKTYNMHDLIRLTHATSSAIDNFIYEDYADIDTWERNISKEQSEEDRAAEWQNLVQNKKLGYLALIRNLRNILQSGVSREWITNHLCEQIYNHEAIRKSLVFPYQIYAAYRKIGEIAPGNLINALQEAFFESVGNIPKLEGRTAIMLDVSGSMEETISQKSSITLKEVGAVYAAALLTQNPESVFIKFGTKARLKRFDPSLVKFNPFKLIGIMVDNDNLGYGTDVPKAFEALQDKKVDRIFLISDMQTMSPNRYRAITSYNEYCKLHGATDIFSFDLTNYHGQIANPDNPYVHLMTALNDKIFRLIPYMEAGQGLKLEQLIQAIKY